MHGVPSCFGKSNVQISEGTGAWANLLMLHLTTASSSTTLLIFIKLPIKASEPKLNKTLFLEMFYNSKSKFDDAINRRNYAQNLYNTFYVLVINHYTNQNDVIGMSITKLNYLGIT